MEREELRYHTEIPDALEAVASRRDFQERRVRSELQAPGRSAVGAAVAGKTPGKFAIATPDEQMFRSKHR